MTKIINASIHKLSDWFDKKFSKIPKYELWPWWAHSLSVLFSFVLLCIIKPDILYATVAIVFYIFDFLFSHHKIIGYVIASFFVIIFFKKLEKSIENIQLWFDERFKFIASQIIQIKEEIKTIKKENKN